MTFDVQRPGAARPVADPAPTVPSSAGSSHMGRLAGRFNRWLAGLGIAALGLIAVVAEPSHAKDSMPIRIVAYGDSLTAGFMLAPADSFPAQLERALKAKGHHVEVINAGVSGDTTAAGLARFDWAVPQDADAAILELGANDALRGIPPNEARANLEAIVERLKSRGLPVLLAGMASPRNWGEDYVKAFDPIFPELARKHGLILYPFFLEGVALDPALNLGDGLHPNARGVAEIVRRIMPDIEALMARAQARRAARG